VCGAMMVYYMSAALCMSELLGSAVAHVCTVSLPILGEMSELLGIPTYCISLLQVCCCAMFS